MIASLRASDTTTDLTPLGYAGDVAQMYDKLPSATVMLAIHHHLGKVRQRYRGRSCPAILLNRLDDDAHRVGSVSYNSDAWKTVTFEHIVSVCSHYV